MPQQPNVQGYMRNGIAQVAIPEQSPVVNTNVGPTPTLNLQPPPATSNFDFARWWDLMQANRAMQPQMGAKPAGGSPFGFSGGSRVQGGMPTSRPTEQGFDPLQAMARNQAMSAMGAPPMTYTPGGFNNPSHLTPQNPEGYNAAQRQAWLPQGSSFAMNRKVVGYDARGNPVYEESVFGPGASSGANQPSNIEPWSQG